MAPGINVRELFMSVFYECSYKLECLSMAGLTSLVYPRVEHLLGVQLLGGLLALPTKNKTRLERPAKGQTL